MAEKAGDTIHVKEEFIIDGGVKEEAAVADVEDRYSTLEEQETEISTNVKPHQCLVCGNRFARADSLKRHMIRHTGEKRYACDVCGHGFRDADRLKGHMLRFNGNNPCAGPTLDGGLKQETLSDIHTGAIGKYSCSTCEYTCAAKEMLMAHVRVHNSGTENCNTEEDETGETSGKLKNVRPSRKAHWCVICGHRFARADSLKRHMITHTGMKPCVCDVCHTGFRDSTRLKSHKNRYNGNNPCGRAAVNEEIEEGTASYHTDQVSDVEHLYPAIKMENDELNESKEAQAEVGENITCDVCELAFKNIAILRGHLTTHNGEKSYSCDFCGLIFGLASDLNEHSASHAIENPAGDGGRKTYSCYTCGYICKEKRTLRIHVRAGCNPSGNNLDSDGSSQRKTSTDEKPHSCHFCGYRFARVSDVRRHVMTHTGKKPYTCDVCHYGFRDASRLRGHKLRFNGMNPCATGSLDGASKQETPSIHVDTPTIHVDTPTIELEEYSCYVNYYDAEGPPIITWLEDDKQSCSCYTCGYTCATKEMMRAHMQEHNSTSGTENWNTVEYETGKILYADELNEFDHCNIDSEAAGANVKLYVCFICGYRFGRADSLKRHMMSHTGEKPHVCDVCNAGFRDPSRLKRHKMRRKGLNACAGSSGSRQSEKETSGNNFDDQMRAESHGSDYTCESEESLPLPTGDQPVEMEDTLESDPCNFADPLALAEGDTSTVSEAIIEEKSYVCDVCSSVFNQITKFRKHVRLHNVERHFSCEFCEFKFIKPSDLKRHVRRHTGEKPYVCDVCETRFAEAGKLKRHKLSHTGVRPYHCELCGSGFMALRKCKDHMRIHTGEKPYPCTVCDSKFRTIDLLRQHTANKHTGDKRHACDLCDARFSRPSTLKSHRRIHTGEKPYACGQSESSFNNSSTLNRHMMWHNGDNPYACGVCDSRFRQRCHLRAHMGTHSKKPVDPGITELIP